MRYRVTVREKVINDVTYVVEADSEEEASLLPDDREPLYSRFVKVLDEAVIKVEKDDLRG